MFEKAFTRKNPLFTLPMYYPLAWYKGPDKSIDPFEQNRQKQVVGLIRTNFLKRFESSVAAFELSCDRLLQKLLAFLEVHSETDAEKKRLERWKTRERRDPRLRAQTPARALGRGRRRGRRRGHRAAGDARRRRAPRPRGVRRRGDDGRDVPRPRPDRSVPRRGPEVRAQARRQAAEAHPAAQVQGACRPEGAHLHRVRRHRPLPQATARRGRHRRRRAGRQRHQGESGRRHPALLALLQRHDRPPRSRRRAAQEIRVLHLHRRPLRRSEPSGRLADDQLRHPLEPGAPDAAHRPRRPAHESGGRGAARAPTIRKSRRRAAR